MIIAFQIIIKGNLFYRNMIFRTFRQVWGLKETIVDNLKSQHTQESQQYTEMIFTIDNTIDKTIDNTIDNTIV